MLHVEDPATFESSIRVPDEHGHPNKRSDEYSSVAHWYQTEPHKPFSILSVEQHPLTRLRRGEHTDARYLDGHPVEESGRDVPTYMPIMAFLGWSNSPFWKA